MGPAVLVPMAIAMTAASAAAAAYSQHQAASAKRGMADHNKRIANQAAADAELRGQAAESAHRFKVGALVSRQRSALAGAGAVVDVGSAFALIEDTAAMGELDVLTVRNNAARETWGYKSQATGFEYQSALANSEKNTLPYATLLGGAGSAVAIGVK